MTETIVYGIIILAVLAFLFAVFFGKPSDDSEDPTIDIW